MHMNANDVAFNVWEELNIMIHVPFTQSDAQIEAHVSLHAVSCCHDVLCIC